MKHRGLGNYRQNLRRKSEIVSLEPLCIASSSVFLHSSIYGLYLSLVICFALELCLVICLHCGWMPLPERWVVLCFFFWAVLFYRIFYLSFLLPWCSYLFNAFYFYCFLFSIDSFFFFTAITLRMLICSTNYLLITFFWRNYLLITCLPSCKI